VDAVGIAVGVVVEDAGVVVSVVDAVGIAVGVVVEDAGVVVSVVDAAGIAVGVVVEDAAVGAAAVRVDVDIEDAAVTVGAVGLAVAAAEVPGLVTVDSRGNLRIRVGTSGFGAMVATSFSTSRLLLPQTKSNQST
jgi:hypothetical protein